jgi:hypothetical protein
MPHIPARLNPILPWEDCSNIARTLSYQDKKARQAHMLIKEYISDMEMYEIYMGSKKPNWAKFIFFEDYNFFNSSRVQDANARVPRKRE